MKDSPLQTIVMRMLGSPISSCNVRVGSRKYVHVSVQNVRISGGEDAHCDFDSLCNLLGTWTHL